MVRFRAMGVLFFALLAAAHAHAVEPGVEAAARYAERLSLRGEYRLAAQEYDRLLSYLPETSANGRVVETMLSLAERSEDFAFAIKLSHQLETENGSSETSCLGRYYRGRALYRIRQFGGALDALELPSPCPGSLKQEGRFYAALGLMRLRRWGEAKTALESLAPEFSHPDKRRGALSLAEKSEDLRFRSPALSGTISAIFPGGGYLYSGSPKSAVAAFLTVGLLAWGAASSFRAGNDGTGVVLATVATGWHFGGVYGSARAARRYNDYLSDKNVGPLEL